MTRTRLGLLGLCAMVFGLMAFSATAAQAEVGAKWLLAKNEANSPLVTFLEANATLETDTVGILHTKIAGITVLFECKEASSEGVVLKAEGKVGEGARIVFTKCETFLNGVLSKPCMPKNGGTEEEVIKTKPGHGLIVLHELSGGVKDDLLLILPDNVAGAKSEIFATIEMSNECAIGSKVNVIGHATLKDCTNALLHALRHLVEIGPLTELWTISKTAEHAATILGSSWAKLTGAHVGLLFSGDPA